MTHLHTAIRKARFEYKIASIYSIMGILWIYLSDTFFGSIISDKQLLIELSIYKGSLYVLITSFLLFYLVRRQMNRIQMSQIKAEESEKKFQTVLESVSLIGLILDVEGNIVLCNDFLLSLTGWKREEVLGTNWFALFLPPEIQVKIETEIFQKTITSGNLPAYFENEIITQAGQRRMIAWNNTLLRDNNNVIVNVASIGEDITERKQSEILLAQEKERLAVTLRSIGDGVITTDLDGKIVMLNKAAEEMTGWSSEDAAGRFLPEVFVIINEHTRELCENPVEKVLQSGSIVELANHTCLIAKDGRELIIADSGAPIRDYKSRITGVVLVFRDMTEKQKLNDSMQRAQKLESLGILAGGIAHDFNNMLAGIFGYLDLAKESVVLKKIDKIPGYLDKAISVFERAKGLTQQLLTFSKGGNPVRKTVQIAPLVRHSAMFALSGSNVTCRFDLADDLWTSDCDEMQIGQVIDNIVINAVQAMPSGGKIIITAVNVTEAPGHTGTFVRISIHDEGVGIPYDIIPKIFDPFFSTKITGHGLGLATVFSIIKRHDGWIDVETAPGKGSTFHVFIPASHTNKSFEIELESTVHKSSGTILVMDDEEFILEIVSSMLESMGYTVATAKDGHSALTLFADAQRLGQPIAASILDLTIPGGIGGKEVAAAMRKTDQNAIIIVSSGYSEDPVIANPTRHGFTDRIIKPYRKNELMELMMRVTHM